MLKNINRLRKTREIQKVFKAGRTIKSANFSLRYAPNRLSSNRFAIVVGTKVDKRATRRNALKRRVREVVRTNIQTLPAGYDIVLSAHKLPNWPLKLADVEGELTELLKKIR
jgi:ribonuclease P protein component